MKASAFRRLRAIAAKPPITLAHQVSTQFPGASILLAAALLVAGTSIQSASAQTVTYAGSGAVNFGSDNVCPAGKTTPAPCSQTLTLTYNITASGTLGTPEALTTGQPNLDYKLASGSTCAGSVTKGTTCQVNVTFAPTGPGARNGAVEIVDSSGNVLATTYIYGSGAGPLAGFGPPPQFKLGIGSGDHSPLSVVVDAAGDVFVADQVGYYIEELLAVNGSLPANPVIKILDAPIGSGMAIDGAGNLFVGFPSGGTVEYFAASGYVTSKDIGGAAAAFWNCVAVDGNGNLFIAAPQNGPYNIVLEYSAASDYATVKTLGSGIQYLQTNGMAIDGSGNVYISGGYTNGDSLIDEFMPGDDYTSVRTIQAGAGDIAVDAAGNIFGSHGEGVVEFLAVDGVVPANPTALHFGSGLQDQYGIALDGRGDVFVTDIGTGTVQELQFWKTFPLDFAATVVGYASSDSPQVVQIQNHGTANLDLTAFSVTGPNFSQVAGGGAPPDCASSTTLAPGTLCAFNITFNPTESGALTGAARFTDNSLNAAGTTETIPLGGTGVASVPVPQIASLSTTYAAIGSAVTLTGANFGANQESNTVSFNGVRAAAISWSNTSIVATVPAGAATGNVVVTVEGESSNALPLTVLPAPSITAMSPTSGPVGTVVTVTGHNLLDLKNNATSTFNGTPVSVVNNSSTAIQVVQSVGPVSGQFQIVVNNAILTTPTFTYSMEAEYTGSPVNFGSVNVCSSGKTTPAPCTKTLALTFNVTATTTLSAPRSLTYGAPNLDYIVASGSTCAGSVTKGNTCTVNVTFAPTQPGARNGAAQVVDAAGGVLVTAYIYGTGVGPRIGFFQPAQRTINVSDTTSVATDGSGNLFVAVYTQTEQDAYVEELLAVNGSVPANPVVKVLAHLQGLFISAGSLAVDGVGNLFFTVSIYAGDNNSAGYLEELLAADAYATSRVIGESIQAPGFVALDGSGNLFVSNNFYNEGNFVAGLYEILAAGDYTTVHTLVAGSNQFQPGVLAVDASGNLFVANFDATEVNGNLLELTPNDSYSTIRTINTSGAVYALAVDPAGNVFCANGSAIVEYLAVNGVLPASPAEQQVVATNPYDLALDSRGNLYTSQVGVRELQFPMAPTLSFPPTIVGQTSNSARSVEIQNQGNATLTLSAFSVSPNYDILSGGNCTATSSLAPSAQCEIGINFAPTEVGQLTGALTFADNSFNAPGSTQSIPLTGEGLGVPPPQIASLSNTYGSPYSVVILNGANFGATQGSSAVAFNGLPTPHYHWSDTQIYVTVPPSATTGNIVVTVGGEASNPVAFTVLPQPKITGISPASGPAGTVVTISGTNLLDYKNKGTVTLSGKSLPIISQSTTALKVAVPTGAVTGDFHVLVNDTGMNTSTFTVTP